MDTLPFTMSHPRSGMLFVMCIAKALRGMYQGLGMLWKADPLRAVVTRGYAGSISGFISRQGSHSGAYE